MDAVLCLAYTARHLTTALIWPLSTSGMCNASPACWKDPWSQSHNSWDLAGRVLLSVRAPLWLEILLPQVMIEQFQTLALQFTFTGAHNCTMNTHLVRHLVHYVRLYGPLWTHSCFFFESLNGQLLRLRHGTHHVCLQVYIHIDALLILVWHDIVHCHALCSAYQISISSNFHVNRCKPSGA